MLYLHYITALLVLYKIIINDKNILDVCENGQYVSNYKNRNMHTINPNLHCLINKLKLICFLVINFNLYKFKLGI